MDDADFFGDSESLGDADYERQMAEREWRSMKNQFENVTPNNKPKEPTEPFSLVLVSSEKTGYLEGVEAAKEDTVQQGFNHGFRESVTIGHEVGELRGILRSDFFFFEAFFSELLFSLQCLAADYGCEFTCANADC